MSAAANTGADAWRLRVTLHTADGREGVCVVTDTGCSAPVWSAGHADGYLDTERATLALFVHAGDGTPLEAHELDGDDWRGLEDGDGLGDVFKWITHPHTSFSLSTAVQAALDGVDPEGWTDAHERVLELELEKASVASQCSALAATLETLTGDAVALMKLRDEFHQMKRLAVAAAKQQNDALRAVLLAPNFRWLDDATQDAVRAALDAAQGAG